jgi:L-rhamnose mutarotase
MKKHYKSVFNNEQELLKALIDIHLGGKDIELDPMYFKGNFYKDGVNQPKYKFDINPQINGVEKGDAGFLPLPIEFEGIESVILDPPFLFGVHGKTEQYYSSKTHTIFKNFDELEQCYFNIIKEACRYLKPNGIMIFKCQDYTDNKTTMTHCLVKDIADRWEFYAKDIAILVKPNKITNPNTTQRHLRKIHTYFWVFQKKISTKRTKELLEIAP